MINKRIFGSDIPIKVKKKLEARQFAAEKTRKPNEEITSEYDSQSPSTYNELVKNEFGGEADLSSRTPFARMWTAIRVVQQITSGTETNDAGLEGENDGPDYVELERTAIPDHFGWLDAEGSAEYYAMADEARHKGTYMQGSRWSKNAVTQDLKAEFERIRGYFGNRARIVTIQDPPGSGNYFWVIQVQETQNISSVKIYEINNNLLNVTDQLAPSQPLSEEEIKKKYDLAEGEDTSVFKTQEEGSAKYFETEHGVKNDANKFLKPPAGITKVSQETEGTLGVIKKTTVSFMVHNFADYNEIYNKYFLRPGAQIFVDFGWNNIDLYDPNDFVDITELNTESSLSKTGKLREPVMKDVELKLYGEKDKDGKDGFVTKNQGDAETVVGIVTDYNSKILENGSVECSLTITSKNQALMDFPKQQHLQKKVDFLLDHFIQWMVLYRLGGPDMQAALMAPGAHLTGEVTAKKAPTLPNSNASASEIADYEIWVTKLAIDNFNSKDLHPGYFSIFAGIFLPGDTAAANSRYISWGFLEDEILNPMFGFGTTIKSMTNAVKTDLQMSLDSTESFTTFSDGFLGRQSVIESTSAEIPSFVVPRGWDHSYSIHKGKAPSIDLHYPELNNEDSLKEMEENQNEVLAHLRKWSEGTLTLSSDADKSIREKVDRPLDRIPIREIFIKTSLVKEAFGDEQVSFKKIIKYMLDKINTDSYGIWNWELSGNGRDQDLSIIDKNYLKVSSDLDKEDDLFSKMFKFNIMSPNSIVKNYNITLETPTDKVSSIYAIHALSGGDKQLFAHDGLLLDDLNLQALYNSEEFDGHMQAEGVPSDETVTVQYEDEWGEMKEYTRKPWIDKILTARKIIYEPDIGDFRGSELTDSNLEKALYIDSYKEFADINKDDPYYKNLTMGKSLIEVDAKDWVKKPQTYETAADKTNAIKDEQDHQTQRSADLVEKTLMEEGYMVTGNWDDYFYYSVTGKHNIKRRSSVLPIKLDLTTYGISSIQPGDIFRVEYLPKIYLQAVYFMVMKVSHEIGTNGWYTKLETQFRTRPGYPKSNVANIQEYRGTFLSAKMFSDIIDDSSLHKGGWGTDARSQDHAGSWAIMHKHINMGDFYQEDMITHYNFGTKYPDYNLDDPGGNINMEYQFEYKMAGVNNNNGIGSGIKGKYHGGKSNRGRWISLGTAKTIQIAKLKVNPSGGGKVGTSGNDYDRYSSAANKLGKCKVIKNFAALVPHMTMVQPVGGGVKFNYILHLVKFIVESNKPLIIVNPQYYWNLGDWAWGGADKHEGYGSWYAQGTKVGIYPPGEACYLIINSTNPKKYWAVSTATLPGFNHTTTLFKKCYDVPMEDRYYNGAGNFYYDNFYGGYSKYHQ